MAKVMLVEDDNNLREIYEARLQAEGYEIVTASDGEQALVVAKAEKPDLVISDVMMPKISGFEMLDILRNTEGLKEVKVIMLTALGQNDDQQRADKLGADRYLVKSQVTLEDIVKASHELLDDGTAAPAAVATPNNATATTNSSTPTSPTATADTSPVATPPVVDDVSVAPAPAQSAAAPATPPEPVHAPPADEPTATTLVTPPPSTDDSTTTTPATTSTPTDTAGESDVVTPTPVIPPAPAIESTLAPAPETTASSAEVAQSTAQEEASVETKIEDFVAGATTDASPPPANSAATSADDKLMDDAVNTLIANTEATTEPTPKPPATTEPVAPPVAVSTPATDDPPASPPLDPAPDIATDEKSANKQVTIANKKIIQPLDSAPKQDINTLLALEEAKAAVQAPPPAPKAVIATNEGGPQTQNLDVASGGDTKNDPPAPDPSNIAL